MAYWSNTELIPFFIQYSLAFAVLLYGSITDLKTREVPDWINYGLLISGLCLNALFSIVFWDYSYIINSIVGLGIFFGIAYLMFYWGQWGGGDSKMLMGLGAMIGIDVTFKYPQFMAGFFINMLFVGALYGLLWSIWLVAKNKNKFKKQFFKNLKEKNIVLIKKILLALSVVLIALALFAGKLRWIGLTIEASGFTIEKLRWMVLALDFILIMTFYLWVSVKSVEKISMYKTVTPDKLTEGDWVVKDIFFNKQYIAGPKDLGIEKGQIKRLIELYKRKKISKVLIKEGIPFVPSFLLAFIFTLKFGNILFMII